MASLEELGVVGAGGGGFPTEVKLRTPVPLVIVNGAECEPLLHKDTDGNYFGEMALLESVLRGATVRALTPLVLLSLGRAQFRAFLDAAPELEASLAAAAAVRHQEAARANEYGEASIDVLADYTGEADRNFLFSQAIYDSIIRKEQQDPNGLNGFILLLHIGSGPGRMDKFHTRFGELLDYLAAKGYQFVRVDDLLEAKQSG